METIRFNEIGMYAMRGVMSNEYDTRVDLLSRTESTVRLFYNGDYVTCDIDIVDGIEVVRGVYSNKPMLRADKLFSA